MSTRSRGEAGAVPPGTSLAVAVVPVPAWAVGTAEGAEPAACAADAGALALVAVALLGKKVGFLPL